MRRAFFLLCFLWSAGATAQQFPSDFWHEGRVVLDSGDTLKGQIKYNLQGDLIQLQSRNRLETYTSRKIVTFEIWDASVRRYRQFYSLPYAFDRPYKAPALFELLGEGKMTMLSREQVEMRTSSGYYGYGYYSRMILVYKYFLLKEDGSIIPYSGKKSDLLELMGTRAEKVRDFIKENKINFDRKYDIAKVVEYYNSLF